MKNLFMNAYDENCDGNYNLHLISILYSLHDYIVTGKISVNELAEILPVEECFLLIFRREHPLDSSIDFMRVRKKF
jgi:hypothetical protein